MKAIIVIACAILLAPGDPSLFALEAQSQSQTQQQPAEQSVQIPADQLDALVAPIALYPDPLLSQTLVASTYPLEIVQLEQWLQKNKNLKDQALVDAVSKQPWDPSIQAMAALPQVVKRLSDDIQWTTELGNAFLAQEAGVMQAIQRMRTKAQGTGALSSNDKQKVETQMVDNQSVIVIEQASPQVVYVPEYNPTVVYGAAAYPYPSIYYPPYSAGGVFAASAISFGVGMAMGAAWGGGWGWGAGWGRNDINVNYNNNFNRNTNVSNRSGTWQHNSAHRGGAPYADRATANRYGSNARGDSLASRQKGAQQQISRQKGNLGSVDRGGLGTRSGDFGGAGAGTRAGGGNVGGGAGGGGSIGSSDRVGNRSVGGGSSSFSSNRGFSSGSQGGFNGSSARSSSSRGSSSMSRGGGGFSGGGSRGGGGFGGGGGGRGGGGRRR